MTVNISQALLAFVTEKVASGQYASAEELVETALLELRNLETRELDAGWLKAKIDVGFTSLDLEGGLSPEELSRKLRQFREHHLAKTKAKV